jgi:uncharacterized protein involved in cysteine biosynthesis
LTRGGLRGAAEAFTLPLEALRLLLRERSLWRTAAFPILISVLTLLAALGAVVTYAGELYTLVGSWVPELRVERWIEWLWIAPATALLHGVAILLFLIAAAGCLVIAYLLASLVAAPFHDRLSRRVEALVSGQVLERTSESWRAELRQTGRSMLEEARRLSFFLLVQGTIALVGVLVPGGAIVAAPALTIVTMVFLPLDYASYVLDRRGLIGFRDKRGWLADHTPAVFGYGAAAFAICLVPGVNFLAMPVLVVGGTLLVLRHPPTVRTLKEGPGARGGMSTSS